VFSRDVEAGRERCREQALKQATEWAKFLKRWDEARTKWKESRQNKQADIVWNDVEAPWRPLGDGRVVHVRTNEIRLIKELAVSAESDRPQGE
jgi:hypothetical protein